MATTKKQTKKRAPSHALFWTLLKEVPGYDPGYKDVIKEGLVHQYSGGRTQSLSEMYSKYPCEYSLMIEAMKGTPQQKKTRYEDSLDKMKKRVIAAICQYVDKLGYTFPTKADKVRYVITLPCRQLQQLQCHSRIAPVGHLQSLLQAQQRGHRRQCGTGLSCIIQLTIMVRIKQDPPKILTSKEKDILEALYVKEDMLLEWLGGGVPAACTRTG